MRASAYDIDYGDVSKSIRDVRESVAAIRCAMRTSIEEEDERS